MAAFSKAAEPCITTYDTTTALCLAHCQVTFFFLPKNWERKSGGNSILPLEVPQMRLSSGKTLSQNKLQQYEGGGKAPRRLAFAEATALAEI